jgi:GNAT superfamily N-acetyltransferase
MVSQRTRSIPFGDEFLELRPCDLAKDGDFIRAETAQNFRPLYEHTYGWSEELNRKRPSDPGDYTMVRRGDETIGFFALHDKADCSYLGSIQLVERVRGLGIGTRLMEHIETMVRATGHRTIRLRVFHVNRAAALYRRLGYVVESSDEHTAMMRKMIQ